MEEKETEGLNPAACYTKRLERCEGTRKQKRGMGVKREGVRLLPSSPPALQGLGWAVNVEGAVRERGRAIGKVLPSLLLSLSLLESPVAPPCRSVVDGHKEGVCGRNGTRED